MVIGTYTTLFDSPMSPWATIITLTLVVMISMVRSAFEDNKRHRADVETNHRTVRRLVTRTEGGGRGAPRGEEGGLGGSDGASSYEDVLWKDISVGDLLRIDNNQEVPADLVLLATSEPSGLAYIETANIDGETNLKVKCSAPTARGGKGGSAWSRPSELTDTELRVLCEQPNSAIHSFSGILKSGQAEAALGAEALLLRGSSLRNTKWAVGLVVYTGRETKLVMNSRAAPFKVCSAGFFSSFSPPISLIRSVLL